MKKKIYVGCYSKNVKSTDGGSHLHNYLPITVFIERARRENLEIYSCQDISSQEKMWRCNHVYEIVFKYKFRERKQFRQKLINVETQPLIIKWFKIKEKVD